MFVFPPLFKGTFVKRYKRFFTDILKNGEILTVHNPNTGSMKNLLKEGNNVLCSTSDNKSRKLPHTLEAIEVGGEWLIVNTIIVNKIVENAINDKEIEELDDVLLCRREFSYHDSRIDFYVETPSAKNLIEVKNCTLFDDNAVMFPDAVTLRGKKHLQTLQKSIDDGYTPYMLYLCQVKRDSFRPAEKIDKEYAEEYEKAKEKGVKMLFYYTDFDPEKCAVSLKKML